MIQILRPKNLKTTLHLVSIFPFTDCSAGNYIFKINNRNTTAGCEICSKLAIKIPEWRQAISHLVLVFLLLTLPGKCRLGIITCLESTVKRPGPGNLFQVNNKHIIMMLVFSLKSSKKLWFFIVFFEPISLVVLMFQLLIWTSNDKNIKNWSYQL